MTPHPDPYLVRVFPRGGVDVKLLSDHIAESRRRIQNAEFQNTPLIASAHEFLDHATAAMKDARKLLPWKQPHATDAAAAANPQPDSGHRNTTDQNLPVTGTKSEA